MSSLVLVALAALPSVSGATFVPGPNGKIAFASGRASSGIPLPAADDSDARIWVADYPSATPVQVTTAPARTPAGDRAQHRHPNWSPDHTKIVYAAGRAFSGRYALWIVDLAAGTQTELVPEADRQDRPSWSPDGTRIAYGSGGKILPIVRGQHLAIDDPGTVNAVYASSGDDFTYAFAPPLVDGQGPRGSTGAAEELLVSATVEPDADRDGFGDETQDSCSTDASRQGACRTARSPRRPR